MRNIGDEPEISLPKRQYHFMGVYMCHVSLFTSNQHYQSHELNSDWMHDLLLIYRLWCTCIAMEKSIVKHMRLESPIHYIYMHRSMLCNTQVCDLG